MSRGDNKVGAGKFSNSIPLSSPYEVYSNLHNPESFKPLPD